MRGPVNHPNETPEKRALIAMAQRMNLDELVEFCTNRYLAVAVENPYVVSDGEFWRAARDFFEDQATPPGAPVCETSACEVRREQYLGGVADLLEAA